MKRQFGELPAGRGDATMTDSEKARRLFQEAGLAFPTIPTELAERLKERGEWLFSTRELTMSPYNLQHYIDEVEGATVKDYAVLCHSGHGVNSYAIQYYLVYRYLRMFLHLRWGGVYTDEHAAASKIRECFSLGDRIVAVALKLRKSGARGRLMIVGSDFYGSYWSAPGQSPAEERCDSRTPADMLGEVLNWLTTGAPKQSLP
jgi:hypothetical protein